MNEAKRPHEKTAVAQRRLFRERSSATFRADCLYDEIRMFNRRLRDLAEAGIEANLEVLSVQAGDAKIPTTQLMADCRQGVRL
jgi:hypothetical protein